MPTIKERLSEIGLKVVSSDSREAKAFEEIMAHAGEYTKILYNQELAKAKDIKIPKGSILIPLKLKL